MPARNAPEDSAARIAAGARTLGVELDARALAELGRYLDELELWNARSNLVGEHDRHALIDRHLVDALAAVPVLRELGPGLRIADLGSGAGLPGVPLAIALRPREMVLVEPRRKRASFLASVRRALPEVALRVLEGRADALAAVDEGRFDAVVSRAALGDEELGASAARLLRPNGLLVAFRGLGDATASDTSAADATDHGAAATAAFAAPISHRYALPGANRSFRLAIWQRRRFT